MAKNDKVLSLVEIDRSYSKLPKKVKLNGHDLTIPEIISVALYDAQIELPDDPKVLERIQKCYDRMMLDVEEGVPIYGCNTGYGARASRVVNEGTPEERIKLAKKMSEGIAHVDVTTGPVFDKSVTRGAMAIRIKALTRGVSAIKLQDLEIYRDMLNKHITPVVNQYGGIGASGDLAHNCRILSAARQLPSAMVWDAEGNVRKAKDVLSEAGIPKLELDPKAGLGFVNGDNYSTSLAAILSVKTLQTLLIAQAVGALCIEVLLGTNRSFHPLLAAVRPHYGQKEVADLYRYLLDGSGLAYQEMKGHKLREKGVKVQDGYSLRGISQYHGVNFDKMRSIFEVIEINANAVSDNPLWVPPEIATEDETPWQWVSGGNFLAMHMVEAMDALRKVMTQTVKLNDRHLARMVNPNENNGLTANLSDKKAISRCSFKGIQIQSGMYEVYSSLLSVPVSTFFGVHEEGNQDITSHALTSGILGLENLRLMRYSTAQNLLAAVQGVDLRGGPEKLSPKTRALYDFVRAKCDYVEEERPLGGDIEMLYQSIENGELIELVRERVFKEFE